MGRRVVEWTFDLFVALVSLQASNQRHIFAVPLAFWLIGPLSETRGECDRLTAQNV